MSRCHRQVRGHSIITFSQNDQNFDTPPSPFVHTYSILVIPLPFLRTFKTLHHHPLLPPPPLPKS